MKTRYHISFVPIRDVTSTTTAPDPTASTQVPVCAANQKRAIATSFSSATTTAVAAQAKSATTPKPTTAKSVTTTAAKCNVGRAELNIFACNIVTQACLMYVQPKTSVVSTDIQDFSASLIDHLDNHYGFRDDGDRNSIDVLCKSSHSYPSYDLTCLQETCSHGASAGQPCTSTMANQGYQGSASECQSYCEDVSNYGDGCTGSSVDASGNCFFNIHCCIQY